MGASDCHMCLLLPWKFIQAFTLPVFFLSHMKINLFIILHLKFGNPTSSWLLWQIGPPGSFSKGKIKAQPVAQKPAKALVSWEDSKDVGFLCPSNSLRVCTEQWWRELQLKIWNLGELSHCCLNHFSRFLFKYYYLLNCIGCDACKCFFIYVIK